MNLTKLSDASPKLNLTKIEEDPLKNLTVEVEWDGEDQTVDLDLAAFACREVTVGGQTKDVFLFTPDEIKAIMERQVCPNFTNMLCFRKRQTSFGYIPKDVLEGGDEPEQLHIYLKDWEKYLPQAEKINLWMTSYAEPPAYKAFGKLYKGEVRLINKDTQEVLQRYDVGESNPNANSMYIGYLIREGEEILFKPAGADSTPQQGKIESIVDVLNFYWDDNLTV